MKMHFYILTFACLILLSKNINAQDYNCGTTIEDADLKYLDQQNKLWQLHQLNQPESGTTLSIVPVQLHIIRTTSGTGGIAESDFLAAFDRVNSDYFNAGIHFYQCSAVNYIDDDDYYDYDKSEMTALDNAHSISNVINIYSSDGVTSGGSPICGHAQFPGGLDFVMLANSCTLNGSTFSHELGHYFNLLHTHSTFYGSELVDGSNCSAAGDLLCDTPADPTLSGNINSSGCIYTGVQVDPNSQAYSPDVTNVMSYSAKGCRTYLSPEQLSRMAFSLTNDRAYLVCNNSITFDSDFYYDYTQDCSNNLIVDFSDATQAVATGWNWSFGDGASSTDASPSHTYTTSGVYNVSLTATNGVNTDTETKNYIVPVGAKSLPYSQDFESGTGAMGDFTMDVKYKNNVEVSSDAANMGSNGLVLEGYTESSSPSFTTPTSTSAFESLWNPFYKSKLDVCIDATTAVSQLQLEFDIKQLYGFNSNYTNFRVLADGTQIGSVYQASSGNENNWDHVTLNLNAYASSVFTLTFEASTKYDRAYQSTNGNATYLDNISVTTNTPLPVELSEFTASWNRGTQAVDLWWKTLSETNNDYFDIQRSEEGNLWKTIGEEKGKGNSELISVYDFQDENPFLGVNYYRLKQVDIDGSYEYSNIVSVVVDRLNFPTSIFPNPTSDLLNIHCSQTIEKITLFNVVGTQFDLPVQESNNYYQLNVSEMNTGIYFIKINDEAPVKVLINR